jgi:GT2 family glycosyltransferase
MSSKLSAVIVTYNRCNDLEECLNSLLNLNEPPSEIIVVDSNSNDGTHELVKRYSLKFVNIKERSMVKARNTGLQHATGEIIAYVDDDVVVSKDWAKYILKPYEYKNVGGVGGRVIPIGYQEKTVNLPEKYRAIGKVFDNGFILNNYDIPTQHPIEVDTLIGCNMSFRRELLLKIGGFDENFMGSCFRDDTDISIRVKKLKYHLIYHPKAWVWHKYKGKTVDRKWFYWYSYNHFYFCFKNFQPVNAGKFISLLRGAFLPPLPYVRKANIKLRPDPLAIFYVVLGILQANRTYKNEFPPKENLTQHELQ